VSATFEAARHVYQFDGRAIPSVTAVLAASGITDVSKIPQHILDRAAAVGTAAHEACALLDADDLDLESLDRLILGYVAGYARFLRESSSIPELIEHRGVGIVSGLPYGFCVDRIGSIAGERILLDLKTSSKVSPSWAIQTIAYALGLGLL
jgi:hypothetical protein